MSDRRTTFPRASGGHVGAGEFTFDRAFWISVNGTDALAVEGAFIRALAPRHNVKAPVDCGDDAEILARFGMAPNPDAVAIMIDRLATRRVSNRAARARRSERRAAFRKAG